MFVGGSASIVFLRDAKLPLLQLLFLRRIDSPDSRHADCPRVIGTLRLDVRELWPASARISELPRHAAHGNVVYQRHLGRAAAQVSTISAPLLDTIQAQWCAFGCSDRSRQRRRLHGLSIRRVSSRLGKAAQKPGIYRKFGTLDWRLLSCTAVIRVRTVSYTHLTLPTIYSV